MRRCITYVSAVLVAASAVALAQHATTPDDLDKAMKAIAPAHGAINKAIRSRSWGEARTHAATVEAALQAAHGLWVAAKEDDAVKMSSDAIAKVKALAAALRGPSPDPATVATAAREYAMTCNSCHRTYRTLDASKQFVLKPGVWSDRAMAP